MVAGDAALALPRRRHPVLIATTAVTVSTTSGDGDPYEAATVTTSDAWPAHISAPSGQDLAIGGDKEVIDATGYLPAEATVARGDTITDTVTEQAYAVVWRQARRGLGLDHLVVGLRAVNGGASG